MGFLNFWAKFSFVGYAINERVRGKKIAEQQYGHVMEEKEQMEKQLAVLGTVESELISEMNTHKTAIAVRPKVGGRDDFLDDRGLSPSQLRSKQLKVLDTVATYDKMFNTELANLESACNVRDNWCDKLACTVEIKKRKIDGAVENALCERFGDNVDIKDLARAIKNGGRLQEKFVFNDAQIIVNVLSEYQIKAKAVSVSAQAKVDSDSAMRNPQKDLPKVAKVQRFVLAGVWLAVLLLASVIAAVIDPVHSGFWVMIIIGVVGALLLFFVHWLLTKPIVALAVKIVEAIFQKGSDMTTDSATFLRGIFLTDIFDEGLDKLDNGLLQYIEGINENYGIFRKWALNFLTPKVLDELLYEVINQMDTGASFNAAINNAEAKADRQLAAKRQEEHNKRLEMENARHNIEMEKQARARAEYERQRAANERARLQATRELADAQRDTARAEKQKTEAIKENTEELKKIRRDLE